MWALAEHIAVPILQLLLTLPLVHSIGVTGFGLWSFNLSLAALIGTATPGVAMAATQLISLADDTETQQSATVLVVASGVLAATMASSIAAGIAHIILSYFTPQVWISLESDINVFIILASMTAAALQTDMVCASALRAKNKFRHSAILDVATRSSGIAIVALAAIVGAGLTSLLAINFFMIIIRVITKATYLLADGGRVNGKTIKKLVMPMIRFSLLQWSTNVSLFIYSSADRIILAFIAPASVVAVSSLVGEMARQIQAIPRAYLSPLLVEMAFSRKRGDIVAADAAAQAAIRILRVLIAILSCGALISITPITFMLLGGEVDIMTIFVIVAAYVISYSTLAGIVVNYYQLVSQGALEKINILTIWGAVANLAGAALFGFILGAPGVAVSRMLYAMPFYLDAQIHKQHR